MTDDPEIDRIFQCWVALENAQYVRRSPHDDILSRLAMSPWESTDEQVRSAWAALTRPSNLVALEKWAADFEKRNPSAKESTDAALRECRARAAGNSG
jgi:hypothetical protein